MTGIPTRDQVPQIVASPTALGRPSGNHPAVRPTGPVAGLTGKDVFRILRKRMWLALITAIAVTGLVMVITALWWLYAPMYTAAAHLEVTPPKGSELRGTVVQYSQEIMNRLMQTHVNIALSNPVLTNATRNPKLTRTPWYNKDKEGAIHRLSEEISVGPVPGTNLIRVSMTGIAASEAKREDLAGIVNAVAEEFETFSRTNVRRDVRDNIANLRQARDGLVADRTTIQRDIQRTADTQDLQERRNVLAIELRTLTTEMIPLSLFRAQAEAALKAFETQGAGEAAEGMPEVLQALEMDGVLRGLRETLMRLTTQEETLLGKFGSSHPQHKQLQAALRSVRQQVGEREKMLTDRTVALMRGERQAAVESATQQIVALREQLNAAQAADKDLQAAITTIERLVRTEEKLEADIGRIDARLVELRVQAGGEQQISLSIPAIKPREISMPKWQIMVPLGIVLGISVGLGLAFLLEFIDTSVKSPSDVSRRVDLPLLGMVPHADDVEEEIDDLRLAFLTHPSSLIGEAFRQIRTCLMFSGPASQRRSLLVTSPMPEDGRTTVALNLAAGFAHGGRKVLVVDANFRQPAIRQLFPECPNGGLSSALVGQAKWDQLVHEVQPGLHVLPAGMLPPNPAELLGSEQMRQILDEMVEKYDQVFIDGAPCLVVADSPILSTLVDGVILTVRAGANTYGIVQRTRDILQRVGAHIVGVTLNAVRVTAGGYFRESYETFYEYSDQHQRLPQAETADTAK